MSFLIAVHFMDNHFNCRSPMWLHAVGQGSDASTVRPHLPSVFDNVADFGLEKAARGSRITHLISKYAAEYPIALCF